MSTSNSPEPTQTPEGPTFEGRLLDRPDEDVVDQGPAFDIRTLMTRRTVLGVGAVGVGAVALAACSDGSSSSAATTSASTSASSSASSTAAVTDLPDAEIPDETAGPYPGDGSNGPDLLEGSGIVRSDIRSSFDTATTTAKGGSADDQPHRHRLLGRVRRPLRSSRLPMAVRP